MTLIKYDHLQVIATITGKFHQNPLKTVGGVAETRLCLRTDGRTDGQTDILTYVYLLGTYIVNFQLKVPNNHHKYPTSPSNLLGIFFGHQRNKRQVPN